MERADAIGFNHAQIADDPANGNALANNEFASNATPPVSDPRKPVLPSANTRHLSLPSSAIPAGANWNLENHHGDTALTLATDNNREEVIKLLCAHGATS